MSGATEAPIIVLVRPQLGENIGKAARAMLNFGLTEMRLVEPRDGWPNPTAGPAASGADQVLAGARVYPTLAQAVADCAHVYATTVRRRGVTKPVLTPEAAAREISAHAARSAIVFGPERSGLETGDVALARAIVTVPINPSFGSLNLAQAVILCAYEWSKHASLEQPTIEDLLPPERARGHDRAPRAHARPARLLPSAEPRRGYPPHVALYADQAGLEPPRSAHPARSPQRAGQTAARAVTTICDVRQFAIVAEIDTVSCLSRARCS